MNETRAIKDMTHLRHGATREPQVEHGPIRAAAAKPLTEKK